MKQFITLLKKHMDIILWGLCLFIFILLVVFMSLERIGHFDNFIYNCVTHYKNNQLTNFFKFISFLACTPYIVIASLILVIISKKNKLYFTLNPICCSLLNQLLKRIFKRPRPLLINLVIERGYSFPSGHSMISVAFYGFLIYLIWKKNWKLKWKLLLITPLSLLIVLVGISRIYLGVHFASDVLGAYMMGFMYLSLFIKKVYNR